MIGFLLSEGGWPLAGVGFAALLFVRRRAAVRAEALARALHELRGPLTAARLGLASGAATGELAPARLRAVDLELKRAAIALQDVGEARRAPPRRPSARRSSGEAFDVGELLGDSVEAWRPAAEARGARLAFAWRGGPALVRGERVRLAQATGNLIHNAIEHGGGAIEVCGRSGLHLVHIEVTDGGCGLPAPVAELVRRPRAGRGLHGRGLAIACGIAAAHGGRIAAAPSRRGARLVLELPIARAVAPAPPLPGEDRPGA
jgi:signal transduction histidine kinase